MKTIICFTSEKLYKKILNYVNKQFVVKLVDNFEEVLNYSADFLILTPQLHNFFYNEFLKELKVDNYDKIIVISDFDSEIYKNILHKYGVDIFMKYDFTSSDLERTLNNTQLEEEYVYLIDFLKNKGVKDGTLGFKYLVEILKVYINNDKLLEEKIEYIYQVVALKYDVKVASVERVLRTLFINFNKLNDTNYTNSTGIYNLYISLKNDIKRGK